MLCKQINTHISKFTYRYAPTGHAYQLVLICTWHIQLELFNFKTCVDAVEKHKLSLTSIKRLVVRHGSVRTRLVFIGATRIISR